ncbi:TATA element modulatory factor 1 TATA binding-domain-containing protein [Geopyxis carbonaria]|nr:TATA element modulatory factor 1 TATA binding-domain-containing protein [Geopyxis carbonaria]
MNFFQKGLAGLESRLDKVLLDGPEQSQPQQLEGAIQPHQAIPQPLRSASPLPRKSAEGAGRDGRVTMQERLAAAMAKNNTSTRSESPSIDGIKTEDLNGVTKENEKEKDNPSITATKDNAKLGDADIKQFIETSGNPSSIVATPDLYSVPEENGTAISHTSTLSREELEAIISRLESDLLVCESRRQEESHTASERIDALEEKLRYLARESAVASRVRTTNTPIEKMLAERDEKIALLIDEGESLSRNELKLQTTIKRLRAKLNEEEKCSTEARIKLEKVEKEVVDAKEKAKRLQETEKRLNESIKITSRLERDIDGLRKDKDKATQIIRELKQKEDELTRRTEEADHRARTEALAKEKKWAMEVKTQVERAHSEAAMAEENLKAEIDALKNKIGRESKRSKAREIELKAEQSVMESKMEALRVRAEEVSSGAIGDAHAKLLRQVETLQTQYAIASENWQGIEGSLVGRIASLEKERDDLTKKEGDIRRKAREMNLRSKTLEADLESTISRVKDLESEQAMQKATTELFRKRALEAEAALEALKLSFRRECEKLEREHSLRLDEERSKWEESSRAILTSRPSSPSITQNVHSLRKISTSLSTTESHFLGYQRQQKPVSRSPSAEPPDMGVTPSSPHQHPDIVSVSTVAAGPSVQLVERMSATVRRLESEMAGSREEITRMTMQRDEARREIIDLMQEVEEKRVAEDKANKLEKELEEMNLKMETSLEMLGEKSELVEELKADVADLKQMYRDLVSATVK